MRSAAGGTYKDIKKLYDNIVSTLEGLPESQRAVRDDEIFQTAKILWGNYTLACDELMAYFEHIIGHDDTKLDETREAFSLVINKLIIGLAMYKPTLRPAAIPKRTSILLLTRTKNTIQKGSNYSVFAPSHNASAH